MIREIQSDTEYAELTGVLRKSFDTVAKEYGLTERNAPTNPAFMTLEKLKKYMTKQVILFGLFKEGRIVGCVAVEPSKNQDDVYYIERLAVIPEERHHGYGSSLLSYAMETIREKGASTASIGIINENRVLKEWYRSKGFTEDACKRFSHLPFEVCFMSKEVTPKGKWPGLRRFRRRS